MSLEDQTVETSCHCGAVVMSAPTPAQYTDCTCSICRRYGALWAYYAPSEVTFTQRGETDTYVWGDKSIAFHRCRACGCVTHWASNDPSYDRMGLNARLMPLEVLASARRRRLDGAVTEAYLDD